MMERIFIIAEAGVNHNGSLDLARRLVDAAAEAGADAVKFQTFKADRIASASAGKADYQKRATEASESQLEMLKKLELDESSHRELFAYCRAKEIEFLSTPYDVESVDLLLELGVARLKLPSGEITNGPLLLRAAHTGLPLIVSTGMAILGEIEAALGILAFGLLNREDPPGLSVFEEAYASEEGRNLLREKVVLLHCTSEYPTPPNEVNLRAMDTLRSAFALRTGYSDHTKGTAIPVAAAARGAVVVEKHFTLNRHLPGPDHGASLEPEELAKMIRAIRRVEVALGVPTKKPASSELKNRNLTRKSLVAAENIKTGEPFTRRNLTVKRPGGGVSPMRYWEYLGRVATRKYHKDEPINS